MYEDFVQGGGLMGAPQSEIIDGNGAGGVGGGGGYGRGKGREAQGSASERSGGRGNGGGAGPSRSDGSRVGKGASPDSKGRGSRFDGDPRSRLPHNGGHRDNMYAQQQMQVQFQQMRLQQMVQMQQMGQLEMAPAAMEVSGYNAAAMRQQQMDDFEYHRQLLYNSSNGGGGGGGGGSRAGSCDGSAGGGAGGAANGSFIAGDRLRGAGGSSNSLRSASPSEQHAMEIAAATAYAGYGSDHSNPHSQSTTPNHFVSGPPVAMTGDGAAHYGDNPYVHHPMAMPGGGMAFPPVPGVDPYATAAMGYASGVGVVGSSVPVMGFGGAPEDAAAAAAAAATAAAFGVSPFDAPYMQHVDPYMAMIAAQQAAAYGIPSASPPPEPLSPFSPQQLSPQQFSPEAVGYGNGDGNIANGSPAPSPQNLASDFDTAEDDFVPPSLKIVGKGSREKKEPYHIGPGPPHVAPLTPPKTTPPPTPPIPRDHLQVVGPSKGGSVPAETDTPTNANAGGSFSAETFFKAAADQQVGAKTAAASKSDATTGAWPRGTAAGSGSERSAAAGSGRGQGKGKGRNGGKGSRKSPHKGKGGKGSLANET